MDSFVFGFAFIMAALLVMGAANGCSRTVEMTKEWPGEKNQRNREKAAKAAKILKVVSITAALIGVVGAIVLALN